MKSKASDRTNDLKLNYRQPVLTQEMKERIEKLKAESINVEQEICIERIRLLTQTYQNTISEPMIIRRAKALKNVLENMTIFIEDGQLIVGNQAGKLRAAAIFPEYCIDWIFEEIDEIPKRPGDRFKISPEVRSELLELAQWWKGRTLQDRCNAILPEDVKSAYKMGVLSANGNMTSGDGHIMLDFPKIVKYGVRGIIEDVDRELNALDNSDPSSYKKRIFFEAVKIAYEGVINFAHRYSDLALKLASIESNERRKAELEKIAHICRKVPEFPAETFHEGLQSVWFMHLISQIESNGHSMSFGRLDQYLYELYLKDVKSGMLTDEEVVELLACLWIKSFGIVKIRPWSHTRFSGGGPTYQNLTLGGITPEGKDAVNNLTMLCLDSVSLTRLPQPNVSARYNKKNPAIYLRKCIEVIKLGFGMPAMHNDDLMIPSLLNRGVTLEDANNYAIVGCIEPIIPGKHGYRAAGMSFTNFPKILEIALNGGKDPNTGIQLLKQDKDLTTFNSFDEVMQAFSKQMEYFVKLRVSGEHVIDYSIEELVPDAFCSGLVQDCIKRGKTPKEGGAIYDMVTGPETGVVNAANSLAAIKKLVFEEKVINGEDLKNALDSNFEGHEGEQIRQMLLNKAPKFGNDDDYVDEIANEVYMIFIRELAKYKNTRYGRGPIGCISYPCTATISANVPSGLPVGASAEGRYAGEALSEGCSPYHGTDKLGPTAVIKSISKMPNILITGGNLLNLKISPGALETDEGMKRMESLIRTLFTMGGWHVQFNVVSSEILKKAKKTPEKYKDLVVRVAGYSALFINLEPATQDDIIARTEHSL